MPPLAFENYHDAYLFNLVNHYRHHEHENAPRGHLQREILSYAYGLLNPVERVCYLPERKANIIFMFAEVLWYLKGDDSLDFISHYCPSMKQYSMDGKRLTGTAYGPKIFAWRGEVNQWKEVVKELRRDPDSKRAVIIIRDPAEFLVEGNKDATCTTSFQFFVRNGRLAMVATMRANDMYRGAMSDVFSFTFLQELLARELGLAPGNYHHHVGSGHVYGSDNRAVERVLESAQPRSDFPFAFPEMPPGDNWESIALVLECEEAARKNRKRFGAAELGRLRLHPYWRQIVTLLEIHRQMEYEGAISSESFESLYPVYRFLVANRFKTFLGSRRSLSREYESGSLRV
jgi:thymidylate synthase